MEKKDEVLPLIPRGGARDPGPELEAAFRSTGDIERAGRAGIGPGRSNAGDTSRRSGSLLQLDPKRSDTLQAACCRF
jgi:hypothetical protein